MNLIRLNFLLISFFHLRLHREVGKRFSYIDTNTLNIHLGFLSFAVGFINHSLALNAGQGEAHLTDRERFSTN